MVDKKVIREMEDENLEVDQLRMYVVWYEYAQYLNEKGKLDMRIYKDWNLKIGQKFDPWWKNNWRLFAQPKTGVVKKITSIPKTKDKNKIYLEISLNTYSEEIVANCKKIIDSEISKKKNNKTKKVRLSKFPISVGNNFDYRIWSRRLKCLRLKDKGIPRVDIYTMLQNKKTVVRKSRRKKILQDKETFFRQEDEKKKIQTGGRDWQTKSDMVVRDIRKANMFLKNIAKGKFSTTFK
tara:strand:- start:127 stop:837 length:711 start_codon:yes stop_codon:yes gene_type:complete